MPRWKWSYSEMTKISYPTLLTNYCHPKEVTKPKFRAKKKKKGLKNELYANFRDKPDIFAEKWKYNRNKIRYRTFQHFHENLYY